jgi:hypothetical protein
MLWIFATNHHYNTLTANDLAAITARFDRGAYFHDFASPHDTDLLYTDV